MYFPRLAILTFTIPMSTSFFDYYLYVVYYRPIIHKFQYRAKDREAENVIRHLEFMLKIPTPKIKRGRPSEKSRFSTP